MSVIYANPTKQARMNAVITQIGASGKIKFLTVADALLITFTLAATAGTANASGLLTFSDNNGGTAGILNNTASNAGKAFKAVIQTSADVDVITGLTIGLTSTAAPAWAATTAYTVGQFRTNGANQYRCTVAGTSAGAGGPTGTGASIADGTVTWEYYSPANADFQLDGMELGVGQSVTVNSATIQHG